MRNRFLAGETVGDGQREREMLELFFKRACAGGILMVPQIKAEIEAALGQSMALSSVYNLLHRHGWRKLAPDKRHPQSDPGSQVAWKKTPGNARRLDLRLGGSSPIKLMFLDEVRFGQISDTRHCWAPIPIRPICRAMLAHEHNYVYGAVNVQTGGFDSLILTRVNTEYT